MGAVLSFPAGGRADARLPLFPDKPARTTLDEFAGPSRIELRRHREAVALGYRLPGNARQGPRLWYVLDLRIRAVFPEEARGIYYVSGSTNGRTAAQIKFTVTPRKVVTETLGLVSGRRRTETTSRSADAYLENYLQDAGVQPRRNVLTLVLETLKGPPPTKVVVLPRSGLEHTKSHPDELSVVAPGNDVAVATGEAAEIPFRVDRRGGRPDVPVTVELQTSPGLAVEAGVTRRYASVGSGRAGVFRVNPTRSGHYQATLSIRRQYNEPRTVVSIVAGEPRRALNLGALGILGGLLGLAALAVGVARRRKRGRGTALAP